MKKIVLFFLFIVSIGAREINWIENLEDAKDLAKYYKKPIFLFLESRRCYYCPIMKEKVFTKPKVIKEITTNFIPVMLDNSTGAESDVEDVNNAPERLRTSMTPAIYFMGPDEEKLSKKGKKHMLIYGFWNEKDLLEWCSDAKRKFKKLYGKKYGYK